MSRALRAVLMALCLLAGLVATASPAMAAIITVDAAAADGVSDSACSLREAVEAANTDLPVDTCAAGTLGVDTISLPNDLSIEVTSQIDITEDLVIQGVSSAATVIDLSGAGDEGFQVDSDSEVTFRQLAVDGDGEPDGAGNPHEAIDNRGDLTLESVYFSGNDNLNDGGAVSSEGNLTITGSTFEDNHGGASGGAVYQDSGILTITDSTFSGNSAAESGGAVHAFDAEVQIDGTTDFTGNTANIVDPFTGGGALYLEGSGPGVTVTIEGDTEFSTNTSASEGGGIFMVGVDLTISDASFINNEAVAGGGLTADCTCNGGSLAIEDSLFDGNEAEFGGGAYVRGPSAITGTTFSGNSAAEFGGALFAEQSLGPFEFLEVQDSLFENNTAPAAGAIAAGAFAQLYITDSTLRGNDATGSDPGEGGGAIGAFVSLTILERTTVSDNDAVLVGGGIMGDQAEIAVVNSTVSGNSVSDGSGQGGGLHFTDVISLFLHSTITDNSALGEGGGVWTEDPYDAISDGSIIAGNPVGGDCNLPIDDFSPNIDSDGSCFPAPGAGSITADPLLGPLLNNGGPTMTHALLTGSPALNIADGGPCNELSGVDQRGLPRPSGGACDLGAFEVQVPAPPPQERTLSVSRTGEGTVTGAALGIDCGSTCSAIVEDGTTGTLVAVPSADYVFDGWTGDCASIDGNECTVEMNGDREVTATFVGVVKKGPCKGMAFGSSSIAGGTERIAGTPGDDVLTGNGRRNVICGLGGNDTIKGKNLGDDLLGGGGNDIARRGQGARPAQGGPGNR